jgi:hypothetical protein
MNENPRGITRLFVALPGYIGGITGLNDRS